MPSTMSVTRCLLHGMQHGYARVKGFERGGRFMIGLQYLRARQTRQGWRGSYGYKVAILLGWAASGPVLA